MVVNFRNVVMIISKLKQKKCGLNTIGSRIVLVKSTYSPQLPYTYSMTLNYSYSLSG